MAEERRVVTVLFADVAGSTALGDSLDPEDARILLRRYYDIARETVAEHGGILEKFIGDAVVAVFGFPLAHDDDPQRALAAALLLRERVQADRGLNDRLPIRIGINTGEVVATRESAAGDFPLTGDAVNVAARLQGEAERWGILCGERTMVSARNAFEFRPPREIELRGKSAPVRAHELVGRSTQRRVASRTPLVGRDADLQQLELAARRALEERRPFLVSVIAPAGVGKTRLLEEFLERLPSIEPTARVAIAQSLPYGQRLTYWPLRGVLFRLVDLPDDAMANDVRAAIRSWLQGSGMEALDREVELLAATMGAGETEVTDRSALLAAWRTFFEIAAARNPLVLVFEDLHWSSDSLLDLFEFVMQPRGELPLLMIALTRPELLDRRPAWGGGRRNYVSISLEPLNDRDTARLVEQLLEGRAPELVQRVVQRAEGNPFFAGELVRAVIDMRTGEQLPDTVQTTVLARLDLLPPDERRTIQLGSVFGRSFRLAGIRALQADLGNLQDIADRLLEKDLVRAAGGDLYTFRHILIREVAFQTLTRAERGRLHAAAAAWLEGIAPGRADALAELIAFHYREAALIGTAQRPDEPETEQARRKAVSWLTQAADVAAAGAATTEGARHLRSAIELAETTELPDLYQRLGAIGETGDFAVPAYKTALRLAREQGRPADQELRIMAGLLSIYTRSQGSVADRLSVDEMQRLRADARKLAEHVEDESTLALYLAADAFFPFWLQGSDRGIRPDELAEAKASATRALDIARRLEVWNVQSMALDALASVAQIEGDWRGSREYARQRLQMQDRLNLIELVDAHSMVAWSSALLGDLEEADRVSRDAVAHIQPGQVPAWTLHLVAWRLYILLLLGRWDEVLSLGERARQLWIESGKPAAAYASRGFVAVVDVARGRGEQSVADAFATIFRNVANTFPEDAPIRRAIGYVTGDLEAVEAQVRQSTDSRFRQAEGIERGVGYLVDHGRAPEKAIIDSLLKDAQERGFRPLEGQLYRARALREKDHDALRQAVAIFEAVHAVPLLARAQAELAIMTHDQGGLDAALRLLQSIGDQAQLGRYERLAVG